jgi:hypothetical protein
LPRAEMSPDNDPALVAADAIDPPKERMLLR